MLFLFDRREHEVSFLSEGFLPDSPVNNKDNSKDKKPSASKGSATDNDTKDKKDNPPNGVQSETYSEAGKPGHTGKSFYRFCVFKILLAFHLPFSLVLFQPFFFI